MTKKTRIYNSYTKRYYAIRTQTDEHGKKGDILGLWIPNSPDNSITLTKLVEDIIYRAHNYSLGSYYEKTDIPYAIKIKIEPRKKINFTGQYVILQYLIEKNLQAFQVLSFLNKDDKELKFNFKDRIFKF